MFDSEHPSSLKSASVILENSLNWSGWSYYHGCMEHICCHRSLSVYLSVCISVCLCIFLHYHLTLVRSLNRGLLHRVEFYWCYQKQSNIVQCFVYSLIPVKNKYQSHLTLPVLLTTSGFLSKPPGYSLLPKWGMYQRKPPANFTFSCGLFIECTEIMLLLNTAFQ